MPALRAQAELEFVQALANPEYLHYLAQHRYFDDPAFISYLEYLRYWREHPYCLYVAFPHCLRMLELLQTASFVDALKRADFKDHLFNQQHWHWKYRATEPLDLQALLGPDHAFGDAEGDVDALADASVNASNASPLAPGHAAPT